MSQKASMKEGNGDQLLGSDIYTPGGLVLHKILKQDDAFEVIKERNLHLRSDIINLLCEVDENGRNPLHVIAQSYNLDANEAFNVAQLLIEAYKKEEEKRKEAGNGPSSTERKISPWLMENKRGDTPLAIAIQSKNEELASYLLSVGKHEFFEDKKPNDILFDLFTTGWHELIEKVLDMLNGPKEEYMHLLTNQYGVKLLHYAAFLTEESFKKVLHMFGPLLCQYDGLLEYWMFCAERINGYENYPFKYVMVECYEKGLHLDIRMALINQLSIVSRLNFEEKEYYPLHYMAKSIKWLDIVKLLTQSYKKEENNKKKANLGLSSTERKIPPWLLKDIHEKTPLRIAIENGKEELAAYIFSLDKHEFLSDKANRNIMFDAIDRKLHTLAESILDGIDLKNKKEFMHILKQQNGTTALHYVPYCTEKYMSRLLKDIQLYCWHDKDVNGATAIDKWLEIGELWPFEYLAKANNCEELTGCDFNMWIYCYVTYTVLDLAVENCKDETIMVKIMKFIFEFASRAIIFLSKIPGYRANKSTRSLLVILLDYLKESSMSKAISSRHEQLAIFFLSYIPDDRAKTDIAEMDLIFQALENNCYKVVKYVLERGLRMKMESVFKHHDVNNNENILHFGSKISANVEEGRQLIIDIVEKFPLLINAKNDDDLSPLDLAAKAGTTWLVKLLLIKDPTSIQKAPKAWIQACEKSHLSTILAFLEDSPYLRSICKELMDSPLHHVKNLTYAEYQQLLKFPVVLELKNLVNFNGKTPLHMAIQNRDKDLAELLLTMSDVDRTIKDNDRKTAMDLLKEVWEERNDWKEMCKSIEVDPTSKLAYIKPNTNLPEMRTTISLVAALLATITFTAGFTLPGGLDSHSQANLANKWLFITFLIVDSCAMCCSMLVLFCIVWSMIGKHDESQMFIDRSLLLLKLALYGTLIAFATGVFLVIEQKTLWVAILISVICTLVILLANRTCLGSVLKWISATNEEQWWKFWNKKNNLLPVTDTISATPATAATTSSTPATFATMSETAVTTPSTPLTAATMSAMPVTTSSTPPTAGIPS